MQPLSLDRFGEPLHDFPAITLSVCNLRPTSRGIVHATSADPPPRRRSGRTISRRDEDRRVAANSIRLARRIVARAGARALSARRNSCPGAALQSDDELAQAAGDIGTTIFHPVGTAKMGRADDPRAVVDAELRVRGFGGCASPTPR